MIDLQILPEKARRELIDYYQHLVNKYAVDKMEKKVSSETEIVEIEDFFDSYSIDMSGFIFNRQDLYERQ